MKNEYSLIKKGNFYTSIRNGNKYNVYEIKITTNNKDFLEKSDKGIDRMIEGILLNKDDAPIEEYLSKKIKETKENINSIKSDKEKDILNDNEFRDLLLTLKILKEIQGQL